jgi:hypothetical protein
MDFDEILYLVVKDKVKFYLCLTYESLRQLRRMGGVDV